MLDLKRPGIAMTTTSNKAGRIDWIVNRPRPIAPETAWGLKKGRTIKKCMADLFKKYHNLGKEYQNVTKLLNRYEVCTGKLGSEQTSDPQFILLSLFFCYSFTGLRILLIDHAEMTLIKGFGIEKHKPIIGTWERCLGPLLVIYPTKIPYTESYIYSQISIKCTSQKLVYLK